MASICAACRCERRKAELAKLLRRAPKNGPVRLSESLDQAGDVLLKHACQLGLEGIISKLRDAPYRPGRVPDWLKTKCTDRQELVVAGYAPSTADGQAIGSLIVGYYEGGELKYAGRTGTGYTHKVARDLYKKLNTLRQKECPFGKVPARGAPQPRQGRMGEAEAGRRSRAARLDPWRPHPAILVPGLA